MLKGYKKYLRSRNVPVPRTTMWRRKKREEKASMNQQVNRLQSMTLSLTFCFLLENWHFFEANSLLITVSCRDSSWFILIKNSFDVLT
jgi:hypothetical protein